MLKRLRILILAKDLVLDLMVMLPWKITSFLVGLIGRIWGRRPLQSLPWSQKYVIHFALCFTSYLPQQMVLFQLNSSSIIEVLYESFRPRQLTAVVMSKILHGIHRTLEMVQLDLTMETVVLHQILKLVASPGSHLSTPSIQNGKFMSFCNETHFSISDAVIFLSIIL